MPVAVGCAAVHGDAGIRMRMGLRVVTRARARARHATPSRALPSAPTRCEGHAGGEVGVKGLARLGGGGGGGGGKGGEGSLEACTLSRARARGAGGDVVREGRQSPSRTQRRRAGVKAETTLGGRHRPQGSSVLRAAPALAGAFPRDRVGGGPRRAHQRCASSPRAAPAPDKLGTQYAWA